MFFFSYKKRQDIYCILQNNQISIQWLRNSWGYYQSKNRIEEQEVQTAVAVKKNARLQLTNTEEEE